MWLRVGCVFGLGGWVHGSLDGWTLDLCSRGERLGGEGYTNTMKPSHTA